MLSLENLTLVNNAQLDDEGDLNIPNSTNSDPLGTRAMPTYEGSYPSPAPIDSNPAPIAVVELPVDEIPVPAQPMPAQPEPSTPIPSVEPPLIPNSHPVDDPIGTIPPTPIPNLQPDNMGGNIPPIPDTVDGGLYAIPTTAPAPTAPAPAPATAPAPVSYTHLTLPTKRIV